MTSGFGEHNVLINLQIKSLTFLNSFHTPQTRAQTLNISFLFYSTSSHFIINENLDENREKKIGTQCFFFAIVLRKDKIISVVVKLFKIVFLFNEL